MKIEPMLKSVGYFFDLNTKTFLFLSFFIYFLIQIYFFDKKLVELVSSFKLYDLQAKPVLKAFKI